MFIQQSTIMKLDIKKSFTQDQDQLIDKLIEEIKLRKDSYQRE